MFARWDLPAMTAIFDAVGTDFDVFSHPAAMALRTSPQAGSHSVLYL